jgi:hypothetical protein
MYQTLLGRPADTVGQAFWGSQLDNGLMTPTAVALDIEASLEYRSRVVEGLFHQLLNREADPHGLQTYDSMLGSGVLPQQIEATLLGSDEYFATRAGNTTSRFLEALYHDVLNRDADSSGELAWSQMLANGATRQQVAEAVLDSDELLGMLHLIVPRSAVGQPYPTFSSQQPLVSTVFFTWYDGAQPSAAPFTITPTDLSTYTWRSVSWFEAQLTEAAKAGIDILRVDTWTNPDTFSSWIQEQRAFSWFGTPPPSWAFQDTWQYDGLVNLGQAYLDLRRQGLPTPQLCPFVDTTTLLNGTGDWRNTGQSVDLGDDAGKERLYQALKIDVELLPPQSLARIDGLVMAEIYSLHFASNVDTSVWQFIDNRFYQDFGMHLHIAYPAPNYYYTQQFRPEISRLAVSWRDGGATALSMTQQILSSDEYWANRGQSDPRTFITQLYEDVLYRQPNASDLAAWTGLLQQGVSRADVVSQFLDTNEAHCALVATWYKQYLDRPDTISPLVSSMLQQGNHDPTNATWVVPLNGGVSEEEVLSRILASEEFLQRGGNTPFGFVERIYELAIGRPATDQELQNWLAYIGSGLADVNTRQSVARELLASHDGGLRWISYLYAHFLRVPPGDSGFPTYGHESNWVGGDEGYFTEARLSPGFDDSAVVGRTTVIVSRDGDVRYQEAWQNLLQMHGPLSPRFVTIETWNEWGESTGIAPTTQYGSTYLDLTQQFIEEFKNPARFL